MKASDKILILGSQGMVGSAILRELKKEELDLLRQSDVEEYFDHNKPDYVFLAAAKVGGILANNT